MDISTHLYLDFCFFCVCLRLNQIHQNICHTLHFIYISLHKAHRSLIAWVLHSLLHLDWPDMIPVTHLLSFSPSTSLFLTFICFFLTFICFFLIISYSLALLPSILWVLCCFCGYLSVCIYLCSCCFGKVFERNMLNLSVMLNLEWTQPPRMIIFNCKSKSEANFASRAVETRK